MADPRVIRFPCPHCGKALKVAESAAGKRARCTGRECGRTVTVPTIVLGRADACDEDVPPADRDALRALTAWDPDPSILLFCVYAAVFVAPIVAMIGIPWMFSRLDLFHAYYLVPAMIGCVAISSLVALVVKQVHKSVPVADLIPRLLSRDEPGTLLRAGSADRLELIGVLLHRTAGVGLMRDAYRRWPDERLKKAWTGIGGWPDSYAEPVVDELVNLLEADAGNASTRGGFGHKERIRELGREIEQFGGIELMRKAYAKVLEKGVYFSEDIWHMIGEWRE